MITFPTRVATSAAETRRDYLRVIDLCTGAIASLLAYTVLILLPAFVGMSVDYVAWKVNEDWVVLEREAVGWWNLATAASYCLIIPFGIFCLVRPVRWIGIGMVLGYCLALMFVRR